MSSLSPSTNIYTIMKNIQVYLFRETSVTRKVVWSTLHWKADYNITNKMQHYLKLTLVQTRINYCPETGSAAGLESIFHEWLIQGCNTCAFCIYIKILYFIHKNSVTKFGKFCDLHTLYKSKSTVHIVAYFASCMFFMSSRILKRHLSSRSRKSGSPETSKTRELGRVHIVFVFRVEGIVTLELAFSARLDAVPSPLFRAYYHSLSRLKDA